MHFLSFYITTYRHMILEMIAVLYDIVLLLYVVTQSRKEKVTGRRFNFLVIMVTVLTFTEVVAPVSRLLPAGYHIFKMYIDVSQFIFAFLCEAAFAKYMEESCRFDAPKALGYVNQGIIFLTLVAMLSNPFNGIISMIEEDTNTFISGPLYIPLGYGPAAYFTLYSLVIFIISFKRIDVRERVFLFVAFGIIVTAAVIQPLMNGKLKLIGLFASFSVFVLYFSLETKDYREMVNVKEKLIDARKSANAANLAKSVFLANMSHEIRTPMNAILGMNDIILRNNNEPNILKYADDMKKSGNELLQIINDVLDIYKIEAGQLEIRDENYQLSAFVSGVNDIVKNHAKEKGLHFSVHVDDWLPDSLSGDVVRLEQILVNIINNAIKFTRKGNVDFGVSGKLIKGKDKKATSGEGNTSFEVHDVIKLEFTVEDTGIGIKEEDLPYIFDNFKRVDMERNRSIQGAGLGLSIVKNLVDNMNGTVDVESYYGRGTRFTVTINQTIEGMDRYIDHANVTGHRINVELPSLLGLRVLVVDDNEMSIAVLKSMLRSTKADVVTMTDSYEGLEVLENEPFDMVFLDYMMPGLDGTDILKKVKETREGINHEVPFIIMCANMTIEDVAHYLELGFYYALPKPIRTKELSQLLEGMR